MSNYNKDPKTVECVWQNIHNLQQIIQIMYNIDYDKRTMDALYDEDREMYDFYYQLNDMAIKLGERKVMRFQQG